MYNLSLFYYIVQRNRGLNGPNFVNVNTDIIQFIFIFYLTLPALTNLWKIQRAITYVHIILLAHLRMCIIIKVSLGAAGNPAVPLHKWIVQKVFIKTFWYCEFSGSKTYRPFIIRLANYNLCAIEKLSINNINTG